MLTLACFDPYTLSIVIDYEALSSALPAKLVRVALDAGIRTSADAVNRIREIDDPKLRSRAILIAAAIWHEKRHFFDYALTGYGADVVRGGMTQMMYAYTIMGAFAEEQRELLVPLDRYANAATRAVLGLAPPPEPIAGLIARYAATRRSAASNTIDVETARGRMQLSGLTAIEALGFYAEVHAVLTAFGIADYRAYFDDLTETDSLNLRYRWADFAAGPTQSADINGVARDYLDVTTTTCSLVAALAGGGKVADAFLGINAELRASGALAAPMDAVQAWSAANDALKKISGTSAIELLRADYARETHAFEGIPDFTRVNIGDLPERFHRLRGRLIERLETDPESVVDMHAWTTNVLPLLQPHYVYVYPSGIDSASIPAGLTPLWRASFPLADGTASWSWALGQDPFEPTFPHAPNAEIYTVGPCEAWPLLVDTLAPLAKLFANGRRQDVVFGPEVERVEHLVSESTPLRFDPAFAAPPDWSDAERRVFFHLRRHADVPCQRCASSAGCADSVLLSPREARQMFRLKNDAPPVAVLARFRAWQPVLLCASCAAPSVTDVPVTR